MCDSGIISSDDASRITDDGGWWLKKENHRFTRKKHEHRGQGKMGGSFVILRKISLEAVFSLGFSSMKFDGRGGGGIKMKGVIKAHHGMIQYTAALAICREPKYASVASAVILPALYIRSYGRDQSHPLRIATKYSPSQDWPLSCCHHFFNLIPRSHSSEKKYFYSMVGIRRFPKKREYISYSFSLNRLFSIVWYPECPSLGYIVQRKPRPIYLIPLDESIN